MTPTNPTSAQAISVRRAGGTALAIILLGVLLRAWNLHHTGYSSDEVAELILMHEPLADIVVDRDDDLFPPLYRVVAGLTVRATGTDLAVRWLSVVCGAATLVVVWRLGAELLGERDAPWPVLVLAVAPFHINFCREGRCYSMYCLLAALMFWGAVRVMQLGSWGNWILLISSTAAAVYTHYFAGPLGVVIWGVVLASVVPRDGWGRPLAASAVATMLVLPTPLLLRAAMADKTEDMLMARFDVEALGFSYVSLAGGFSVGPSVNELRAMPASQGVRQFLPWMAALGFAFGILGWQACRRLSGPHLALLLVPLLALVPALGVVGNLVGIGFMYRYVGWMVIAYALILGAGASRWRESRLALAAVMVLLAVNAVAIYNRRFDARYADEDYRAVAQRLDELDPAKHSVIVASHYMGTALRYYVAGSRPVASFPIFANHADDRDRRLAEFNDAAAHGERFWIVSQWLPPQDTRRAVRDAALANFGAKLEADLGHTQIYSAVAP